MPPLRVWLIGAERRLRPLAAALATSGLDPASAAPADRLARGPVIVDLDDPGAVEWLAAAPPGVRPRLGWGGGEPATRQGQAIDVALPLDPTAAAAAAAEWLRGAGPLAAAVRRWGGRLLAAPDLTGVVGLVAEAALEIPGVAGALAAAAHAGGPGAHEPEPAPGHVDDQGAEDPAGRSAGPVAAAAAGAAIGRLTTAAGARLLAGQVPRELGDAPVRRLAPAGDGWALLVLLDPSAGPPGGAPLDEAYTGALVAVAGLAVSAVQQEEALRSQLASAELHVRALEQTKSALLANVSHELRTPLVSIKGYSELMLKERVGPVNATQREFLSIVLSNVSRLVALIDNLLVYSRMSLGGQRLVRERLDLREVIEESMALLRPAADAKGVRLEAALGAAPVEMRGDRRKLGLVFTNVLSNAVKFNRSGGCVSVEVAAAPMDPARPVTVSVADTGIGIPAAALERIFEQFYQVDGTFTRQYGGAGLGLSIVKDLVTMHGGDVRVSSAEGEGTTVVLSFPRAPRRSGAGRRR